MIELKKIAFSVLCFVLCAVSVQAQSPKQEFRAVWFQTVWAGDWPKSYNETTQKKEFTQHLDRFEQLGINAVCFQIRNMCDAVYNSKYEPWCKWVTGTRGQAPNYDPLAYLIEKAHERGMEVHVWMNPYRFASDGTYGDSEGIEDYRTTHPEWIKYCQGAGIYVINPSDPAVRQQIVNVIMDVMDKYDIDGVIFDDYFYQSGYKDEYDDEFYAANNPDGLSRGDWRRHQVNLMVQDVYNAIKARAPWCRFGIGPAGVAASDRSVAAKYGISPCPDGSDWQYSGIYSEPVQWYVDRSVDYMAPQVYWPIGDSGNDYAKITPWWYEVAHHFGRHCYISQSLSGLSTTTLNKPMSKVSQSAFDAYEINRQLQINYDNTREKAPGMTFFNASGFKKTNFIRVVTREQWTHKAKVPAMTWYTAPKQGVVDNMTLNGQNLTWTYPADAVRYGVYAIPLANRNDADIISSSAYYLGMSYAKSYTLPDDITTAAYALAVTVIDRYGNEWAPRFYGEAKGATVTPQLVYPADGGTMMLPNRLKWQPIAGATGYTVQVSETASFDHVLVQAQTDTCAMSTKPYIDLSAYKRYYWRVCAHAANAESNWSSAWYFDGHPFSILSPANGTEGVSHAPLIEWEDAGNDKTYVLEIATANTFRASEIVYSATTTATSHQVPDNKIGYRTVYYARVRTTDDSMVTTTTQFKTEEVDFVAPVITSPAEGGILAYPTLRLECSIVPNNGFKFEVSTKDNYPTRGGFTKRKSTDIGVNWVEFEDMEDGVYYAHVATLVTSATATTYSKTVQFTYTRTTGITDVKVLDSKLPRKVITAHGVMILREGRLYDLQGKRMK